MSKKQDVYKIMVLNWKWEEELGYPEDTDFLEKRTEEGKVEVPPKQSSLEAADVHEVSITDEKATVIYPDAIKTFVLPTKVWGDHKEGLGLRSFTDAIIEAAGSIADSGIYQLLILLHKGDQTPSVNKLAQLTVDLPEDCDMRFALFGGGREAIYEESGLLDHGFSTFRLGEDIESESGAAWFDNKQELKALIIKKTNFKFVWDYYWYQTRTKLEQFRKETLLAQIPKVPDGPLQRAQEHAKSLLFRLDNSKYKDFQNHNPSPIANYEECADLEELINVERFKKKKAAWITEIESLADKTINDTQTLNEAFEDLLKSW